MKGIAISTIIALVIGVIILVVLTPLLLRAASNVWDQLSESLGIVKYSPIERALICYYYLCTEGCSSPKFNDFCSADKIGRENYEEVCSLPAILGVDGEQCHNAYWQFPMRIKLDSESELSMDRLKKKVEREFVVIKDSNTEYYAYDYRKFALFPDGQYMTDKEYWNYETSTPKVIIKNAVKFGKVKPDSIAYDIAGVILKDGSIEIPFGHFLTYYIFYDRYSYNKIPVDNGRIIRMSIEDEKTDDLKDYNYLMKVEGKENTIFPSFSIKFWNWANKNSPQEVYFVCSNKECSDIVGSVKTFVTAKGSITIGIEDVKVDCADDNIAAPCSVYSVTLNITYIKT
jgi:hypothetical protein